MHREINRLIKDVGKSNEPLLQRLIAIAHKVVRRKDYLIIDIMEMESIVDEDRVIPIPSLERVEIEK